MDGNVYTILEVKSTLKEGLRSKEISNNVMRQSYLFNGIDDFKKVLF